MDNRLEEPFFIKSLVKKIKRRKCIWLLHELFLRCLTGSMDLFYIKIFKKIYVLIGPTTATPFDS